MDVHFSIIIPTFNSEKTIKVALSSILNQSFDRFEIIIVDGASKDNTVQVIKEVISDRIRLISEPDNGIYHAMNKGIRLAKGKYLFFLGSDDQLINNGVLSNIAKCKQPLIVGSVQSKENIVYQNYSFEQLTKRNLPHQGIFYHKSLFQLFGKYDESFKILADWDFNLKLFGGLFHRNIKFTNVPVAIFGTEGISTTDNSSNEYLKIFNGKQHVRKRYHKGLIAKTVNQLKLIVS